MYSFAIEGFTMQLAEMRQTVAAINGSIQSILSFASSFAPEDFPHTLAKREHYNYAQERETRKFFFAPRGQSLAYGKVLFIAYNRSASR